jgi:hypothetical protein
VLPVSCIQNAADSYSATGLTPAEMIIGLNYPILITKDDPAPAYLMPTASDLGAVRIEIQQLKSNMFDSVGLMLQHESRQVASAESKAWDFLDVAQVMSARAEILESVEQKVAAIVNAWDASIPAWEVSYNRQFDIGDFGAEINALIMTANASMPAEMYRMVLRKIFNRLDRLGSEVSDEQRKEIEAAIDEFSPNAFGGMPEFEAAATDDEETNLQAPPEP